MARDFLHTEALIDAVLSQIETHGPAAWFERGNRECLKALAFGDFMDYALRFDDLVAETPAILVRGVSVSPEAGFHGTAGVLGTGERLQVVMVWPWEHTLDDNGTRVTVARGKARYAKLLSAALFYDHRLSSPNLPGLDQAQVVTTRFESCEYDLPEIDTIGLPLWGLSIDMSVLCRSGGG